MQVETKFNVGDRAYFTIFATATVYALDITKVYLRNGTIYYDAFRIDSDFTLEGIPEEEIGNFVEAKAKLVSYLQNKLAETVALVAP